MEVVASALSLVSFALTSFHGCVRAFEYFSTAQNIGSDGDLLRVGLEFEKYRLLKWAERSGLGAMEKVTLNWSLANGLMEQLLSLLTSAEQLRHRYSLKIPKITEEIIESTAHDAIQYEESKPGVSKLITRLKPITRGGRFIQNSNSQIKRLRWAVRDKDNLKRFLGEVTELINKLEHLLDRAEADANAAEYNKLLRDVLSLTSTAAQAGQIKEFTELNASGSWEQMSISAAAHLKQIRLIIGADRRDDELTPGANEKKGVKMPILDKLKRSLKPWGSQDITYGGAEFAMYKNKQVLIQWRVAEGIQWELYENHMKCLAVLLMSLEDPSFRSLQCMGYYPLEREGRHGIMYTMPDDDTQWEFKTLDDLLTETRLVPLHRRLNIAKALSETILQLHTAGWMHKNLRSQNIIFLAERGSSPDAFLQTQPIIIGYDYARPDNVEAAVALTQMPDTDLRADLYRHPQARGAAREVYQKRFDMYGLGCVILELITWTHLVDLFVDHQNTNLLSQLEQATQQNAALELPSVSDLLEKKSVQEFLSHQAGERAKDIVQTCVGIERKDEDDQWSLREQNFVVDQLTWCRI